MVTLHVSMQFNSPASLVFKGVYLIEPQREPICNKLYFERLENWFLAFCKHFVQIIFEIQSLYWPKL